MFGVDRRRKWCPPSPCPPMKRSSLLAVSAAVLLLLSSCKDNPTSLDRSNPDNIPTNLLTPSLDVLDGYNGGGNPHFFWLKPISDARSFDGVADSTQLPTVEICLRDPGNTETGCASGPPVASYTRTSGKDQDRIVVDDKGQYFVHWRMKDYPPQRNGQYRVRALIFGKELGHADVIVLRQNEIKAYNGDLIPVSDKGAFKIAFRIEEGALCSADAEACATTARDRRCP